MALPDAVSRSGVDAFVPAGRHDGAVQVGGVNVHSGRVAEALRGRPGVADAAVRPMRPEEGSRLKAFVVPDGTIPQDTLDAALAEWLARSMDAPSRPVDVRFGASVPRNALGKPADW